MDLRVVIWNRETPATEEALLELLQEQDLRVYNWSNEPNDVYHGHTHGYHKVLYVVKGSIRFELPTRNENFTLRPGDRLDLPAGIRHAATVGPVGVTCFEAHVY